MRVTITKAIALYAQHVLREKLFLREKKRDTVTWIAEIVNRPRLERRTIFLSFLPGMNRDVSEVITISNLR